MPTPNADGPDIAGRYQHITGPIDPSWRFWSHKFCEGQRSTHPMWREFWALARNTPTLRYRCGYHWIRSDSTIKAQADFAVSLMRQVDFGEPGDIWINDWETTPGIPLVTSVQTAEYNDRVRQAIGWDCVMTYSSDWLPDSTLDADSRGEFYEWREENPDDALHFANYNTGTRSTGGWAETEKYDADVWQWTSSFRHPAITSHSGGGFDMNHIRRTNRLDSLARYQTTTPDPTPEDDMPRRELIVKPPVGRDSEPWFYLADAGVRYAIGADVKHVREAYGDEAITVETDERYDYLSANVFGQPAAAPIVNVEVPAPAPIEFPPGRITWE